MTHQQTESLRLAGWRFEQKPRRTLAKLRHADQSLTCIEAVTLLHAPEYLAQLSEADRAEVREMALQSAA